MKYHGGVFSARANHTAGDFLSGIPCGLGTEVVRPIVDHNGFSENLGNGKPAGEHSQKSSALTGKKGRQIPCVHRMHIPGGIEMTPCIFKIPTAAVGTFVDMQSKKLGIRPGQAADIGYQKNILSFLVKTYGSKQTGCFPAACHTGNSPGFSKLAPHTITSR